jgi:membrane protease YdiL (CAAX protease family)
MTSPTRTTPRPTSVDRPSRPEPAPLPQYSRRRVLLTWLAAAVPMWAMAWLVGPWLASILSGPSAMFRALIVCLTAGMVWQFVLVLLLVRREQGSLRWPVVRNALWLRAPRSPRTGRRGGRLWLVVIPLVLLIAAEELLPTLPTPATRDLSLFLGSSEGQSFLSGNWGWFAVLLTMWIFNTVLGEELFFRGLLLPRMQGAFGRWDWVANGVLFAAYHLHVPWVIPQTLLVDTFAEAGSSRRYRSALLGIAVHSAQTVYFAVVVLLLVLH